MMNYIKAGVNLSVNEIVYTASTVYNKPNNLIELHAICIGGGGGGASGRRRASLAGSAAGGGGGAGALARLIIPASAITSTVTITVGQGGVGGASQTSDDGLQNAGSNGEYSSFGGYVIATGGTASATNAAGTITNRNACYPQTSQLNLQGGQGANGGTVGAGSNGVTMAISSALLSFGGGGGGAISTIDSTFAGGAGSRIFNSSGILNVAASGGMFGASGGKGVDNWVKQIPILNFDAPIGYGSGGGGGASSTTSAAGHGGNGGIYGGGGGGGGASLNGFNSGSGGTGGQGCVIVYEILKL